jgi:Rad3-related DNA helicase
LAIKSDTVLKEWMEREKAAVDYGRRCDKRIAELEAQVAELEHRIKNPIPPPRLETTPPGPERQAETLIKIVNSLTSEIQQLRSQLTEAITVYQAHSDSGSIARARLLKLEALADMAQLGLTEELRVLKKAEPAVEDTLLVTDGEDQIPPRWLPLKRALQNLYNTPATEAKKVGNQSSQ